MLVKRKDGPTGAAVLLFGVFAFLFANRPRAALLCEHCRTIFEVRDHSIPRSHYPWIFLILLLIAVAGVVISWFTVEP